MANSIKVLAFTHKQTPISELHRFFLDPESQESSLHELKKNAGLKELMYLATCNRIEFICIDECEGDDTSIRNFFSCFNSEWSKTDLDFAVRHCEFFTGNIAVAHLMRVAASLDSMVVGEREIITQFRLAYERCQCAGLTGDGIRLLVKNVIQTAKKVFSETTISESPVSVVSLAYRRLRKQCANSPQRIIMVGAGETNQNLLKYLTKNNRHSISIFNRTLHKAEQLAAAFAANATSIKAYPLHALDSFKEGFDILISCTASPVPLITTGIFKSLTAAEDSGKMVVDLAMPADVDSTVRMNNDVTYVGLAELKAEAEKNLGIRRQASLEAEKIILEGVRQYNSQSNIREVELLMQSIPASVNEIKAKALTNVFFDDIETMDENSRAVLHRVIDYFEKKYISLPMVMAKELLLKERNR